ncbi:MAG: branched-chain amino acid ABC transporter permease [Syntrophobacteraceae bacterium]
MEQLLVNGVIYGSILVLPTIAFGFIFGVTTRFHFAMGVTYAWVGLITQELTSDGIPFILAAICGIATGVIIGVAVEKLLYRPLVSKTRGSVFLQIFLTGWAFLLIGNSFGRMIWGSTGYILNTGFVNHTITLGKARLSSNDVLIVAIVWVFVVLTALFIKHTTLGRSIAAVRANFNMSQVVGIDPDRTYTIVFALFSFLAAVAGLLHVIKFLVVPDAGDQPVNYAFVSVFIAGTASGVFRFALSGFLIGIIANICTYHLDVKFSPVFVFGILFLFVALLPYLRKIKPGVF